MRSMVLGERPRRGSTKGATAKPVTVRISTRKGNLFIILAATLLPPRRAEQPVGPQHKHQSHSHEQHYVGVARVEHGGDTDDLAGDEPAEHGAGKRSDAANHH